jgi:hypothetical protein
MYVTDFDLLFFKVIQGEGFNVYNFHNSVIYIILALHPGDAGSGR